MSALPELRSLDEVATLVASRQDLYLRYSQGPEDDERAGPSRDHEADLRLPGWSVSAVTPERWWTRPVKDWVARRLYQYAHLGNEEGRYAWLLTGSVTARGTDHEPLVVDMQPVAAISADVLAEAAEHYRARFHAGRDSTDR